MAWRRHFDEFEVAAAHATLSPCTSASAMRINVMPAEPSE